ncbi:MAG: hypothetical protein M3R64_11000 [Pseudomonadota bacterium]|nr:hypothetical protein [Pseudomonadota bacterium]
MIRVALFAVCMIAWVGSASGQRKVESDTGSHIAIPQRARIPDAPGLTVDDRARIAMAEFARCTVDRRAIAMRRVLSLPIEKLDGSVWMPLADTECLASGEMRFQPRIMRGALFSELVRRRAVETARGGAWTFPVMPYDAVALADPANRVTQLDAALLAFADCVVKRDPVGAQAVIVAPTATEAESVAIAALAPNLGPCLPAGQTIKLSRSILEGAVAEILYRVPVQPVVAETK